MALTHESHFSRAYGVAGTVEGGAVYQANPFEIVPVDLSAGSATINLPPTPFYATRVLVKIRAAGAGNLCLIQAGDNDSIDWVLPALTLTAEGDWYEFLFNDVDGTWLVVG
jgi:hypothetical protein